MICPQRISCLTAATVLLVTHMVAAQDHGYSPPTSFTALPVVNSVPLPPVALPATDLEARIRQLEEVIHQQARRQQELEQQLLEPTSARGTYLIQEEEKSTLEERLLDLEKSRQTEADAQSKKKAEDAKKPTMKWAGRIHADYWAFPETSPGANAFENGDATESVRDRVLFRRVRLSVGGTIADNMLYAMQLDFNNPDSPQFKDVYLGWNELPFLQTVLVGNQKRPYGLDHLNSSNNNIFLERPFVVEAFNQDARRFGVCSYNVSENQAWNWRYGAYLQQDLQNTGTVFSTPLEEDYQAEVAGRLANTVWYDESSGGRGYAHWAVAGTVASPDGDAGSNSTARFRTRPEARTSNRWIDTGTIDGADTYELLALEGVVNYGAVQIVGEYQSAWMQRDAGFNDVHFDGGYVYASYFLTGEHMVWDRTTGSLGRVKPLENFFCVRDCDGCIGKGLGAWQVAARYSHGDFTDQDILGGVGDAMTLGLVWWWNQHARVQMNYVYGNIDQHEPVDGQTSGDYHIIGTRFHVDF